jgi:uncharacterized membrane protein YesL
MARRMWQRGPDGEIVRVPPSALPPEPRSEGEESAETPAPFVRRRARLALGLRLGLRDTYDHLGALLLLSLVWTGLVGFTAVAGQTAGIILTGSLPRPLAGLLIVAATLVAVVLVGAPLSAGLFRYARNAAARLEPEVFDLGWGFRSALRPSLALGALQALGIVVLGGNCYFYLAQRHPVVVVIGAVFGYLLAFWLLACLYQWPLLAEQELAAVQAVKKSALLTLDNFPFTLGLALVLGVVSAVLWLTVLGGVVLWPGLVAMVATQATRELLRKYGVLGPDPTLDPMADETHDLDR